MKLLKTLFELAVPIFLIFTVFPRVIKMIKDFLDIGEKPKKKKKPSLTYSEIRQLQGYRGNPPPPPLDRRREIAKQLDGYEVRDGQIVKKGKKKKSKVQEKIVTKVPKKKHFTKGVDPDFL